MNIRKIGFLLLIGIGVSSCSSVNVSTDYDESSDFTSLKNFNWHSPSDMKNTGYAASAIMDSRIRKAIEGHLSQSGFLPGSDKPDFLISYSVTTQDKIDIESYNTYGGYASGWRWDAGYGHRGMRMGMGMVGQTDLKVLEYTQGTLIVDIIDPATNKLIWRGMGSKKLPSKMDPDKADKLVTEVVSSILANFPPG